MTPSLQLQPCFQRVLGQENGAPIRFGAALRWRVSACRRARSSTSDTPCRCLVRSARVSSFQSARTASTAHPSRDAAFTTQSAFHQQVPLGACLRRTRRSPPPYSRRCRLRAGFRRSALPSLEPSSGPRSRGSPSSIRQKAALPAARGFRPERSADWITPPVNFCNRYGS